MDIEYYVEASQAKEQKIVAWGCFARQIGRAHV